MRRSVPSTHFRYPKNQNGHLVGRHSISLFCTLLQILYHKSFLSWSRPRGYLSSIIDPISFCQKKILHLILYRTKNVIIITCFSTTYSTCSLYYLGALSSLYEWCISPSLTSVRCMTSSGEMRF